MLHSLVLMTFSVQIFAIIKGTVTSWTEHLWLFQYTYLGENHIVHRFCLGRVGGSRSSDAPATGWVFVQLIVYSPYVNRTWSLIAFTIFLQVSSFRAASYTREENPQPEKLTNRMNSVPNAEDTQKFLLILYTFCSQHKINRSTPFNLFVFTIYPFFTFK